MSTTMTLQPKTGFVVSVNPTFAKFDRATLINYYQPLMSPAAVGLFYALEQQTVAQPTISNRQPHLTLMTQLNLGLPDLLTARRELEAVGLLRTFEQVDAMGTVLIYELQPTMTPTEFLADDLLSVLLLQMVGEARFKVLSQMAHQRYLVPSQAIEVTASFLDVYHLGQAAFTSVDPVVKAAREANPLPQQQAEKQLPPLDWQLLGQQVTTQGLSSQVVSDYRALLATEAAVYGLDELTLGELMIKATDVVEQTFDPTRFKVLVRQHIANGEVASKSANRDEAPMTETPEIEADNWSENERRLLQQVATVKPYDYLRAVKQATNSGYVSNQERQTLERLVQASGLSLAAVNILINYILVERGNATLSANFADAIANSWRRAGVKTPGEALVALREYQQRQQRPRQRTPRRVKEKLPAWAKDKQYQAPAAPTPSTQPVVDASERDALLAQLREKQADFQHQTDSQEGADS